MKEDILEQAVDDWFLSQTGTFTKHNIKFKPSKEDPEFKKGSDAVNSDIDILAVHTNRRKVEKVSVVSCKSWQSGFSPEVWYKKLKDKKSVVNRRDSWRYFREVATKKWGKALASKVFEETGSKHFTYYLLVTKLKGRNLEDSVKKFENDSVFIDNLKYDSNSKVKIKILTFKEIFDDHFKRRNLKTLESSELGRLIQILKASGVEIKK